jgi:predicted aconitase
MTLELSNDDRAMLAGDRGEAAKIAMGVIVEMAQVAGATRLIDITSAHIDGCLYHGRAGLDWAEKLVRAGARVVVPTTLNVSSLDLLHPNFYRGDPSVATQARRLMDCYVAMGCSPSWTCAPYLLPNRPTFGEQIAWAESNAIAFVNSVVGARTERYGDFIDICAAVTGRVPDAGLHRAEHRRGQVLFTLDDVPRSLMEQDVFFPVLGHLIGGAAGTRVPVIDGLQYASEDQLKALGAAAASSGAVALFHVVGITPEAPTVHEAFGGRSPEETVEVTAEAVVRARDSLTTFGGREISGVSLGAPHFSIAEFAALLPLIEDVRIHPAIEFYVSTNRFVLEEIERRAWADIITAAGIQIVVDTCTYITPILKRPRGAVMTNSAKWAYYAPGNIEVDVVFGSTAECIRSAAAGRVWRDESLWRF